MVKKVRTLSRPFPRFSNRTVSSAVFEGVIVGIRRVWFLVFVGSCGSRRVIYLLRWRSHSITPLWTQALLKSRSIARA